MKVKTHRRKSRKRNPAPSKRRQSHRRRRHNPMPSATRHRRRRSRRRNPSGGMVDLLVSGGVVAGSLLASGYVNSFAAKWIPVKFRGVASIAIGAGAAMFFGKNEKVRLAAVAAIGAGGFDILRQNIPQLAMFSAEDAGYLLGSAATHEPDAIFGAINQDVPGVLPNVFGAANADVPGVLPNVFGVDTGTVPMGDDMAYLGVDTGTVPMGFGDEEGDGMFSNDWT